MTGALWLGRRVGPWACDRAPTYQRCCLATWCRLDKEECRSLRSHALPEHRRPVEFGGFGKDPVWGIEESDLGPDLSYRPDPDRDGHGFIEPARPMPLKEYQEAIERTLPLWMPEVPAEGGTSDD